MDSTGWREAHGSNPRTHQRKKSRPKVVYDTPGRECQHADRGCCPRCFDPIKFIASQREHTRRA